MDKPSHLVTFLNENFNPMFEFVHILPNIGLKQPSIFRVYVLNVFNKLNYLALVAFSE